VRTADVIQCCSMRRSAAWSARCPAGCAGLSRRGTADEWSCGPHDFSNLQKPNNILLSLTVMLRWDEPNNGTN